MCKTILSVAAATALAAAALVAPGVADAATSRTNYVLATGVCQPATPLQLGGLRFRPLGIFNNKPTSIYVSCALETEFVGDDNTTDIRIWFDNQGTAEQTVQCTAIGGRRGLGATSVAGETTLAADVEGSITFTDLGRVSTSFSAFAISCLVPPKVEMGLIRIFEEDVGDGL